MVSRSRLSNIAYKCLKGSFSCTVLFLSVLIWNPKHSAGCLEARGSTHQTKISERKLSLHVLGHTHDESMGV